MSTFKCKMCGGTLEIQSGSTVAECEYCGAKQTLPKLDDEKRANLYDRANHFRRSNEFDKASAIYEQILAEDNTDAEAYWSLVLCRYGIEYVEDPLSHRRVPTVHRAQFTSIFDDDNYKSALKNSDTYQRVIYEEEAKAINEIQKGILAISQKEEPFDVFICYKETDDSGKRTHDSVLAQDLYYQLKQEGFKVFFSRITLEDKLGSAYEPYIFAALNSAKVMVVLGTKPEYFNAVWVKNEWSRFLSLIKKGEKKMLIPAYKDMDPYNLPKEFSHLQAQDMSKLGFMQDLIRGIKKILGRDKKPAAPTVERVVVQGDGHAQDAAPLLRRAFLFLEDGEFDNADEYAEKVLDINPECAEAYVVKLLIELRLKKPSDLAQCKNPISDSHNYQKAIRFASPEYRETIEGYNNAIIKRIDTARKDEVYARGVELMRLHRYDEAVQYFQKIPTYKDATQKIDDCKKLKETERRDGIYERATQLLNAGQFDEAARLFESIEDHKDSKEKIKLCGERKETARKDAIYSQAMNRVRPQNADDAAIKKSIEELQTISGYRDVDDQIRALNARLEKWYEDKKKAEEAARIKAEEDRRTREREEELRRIKAEKTKKTVKKVAKIGIPSVVALATLLILLFTLVIPLIRYNKADELFNAGKYDEAMEIYQDIGGFSDSEQRITVLTGIEKIDDAAFEEGIEKILSAGVPVKLTYGMGGGDFSGTTYLSAPQEENNNGIVLLSASTTPNITPLATTTASVPETTEFTYNSSADFSGIQTPGRSGYRFVKWELETYNYQVGGTFEMKLNAVWSEKEYTIEYDLNDGKVTTNNPVEYGIEDDSFTLINPTKTGYTFIGWTGTGLDGLTMSVTIEKGSVGDRSYEANWQANTYTITLNPNGGSIANTTITVTYDQAYTLNDPEWTGHTFGGWYEGNKKVTSGTWTRTSDLELTAKWDIVEYDITYNLNSGNNSSSNPATYTVDDEVILVSPTRTGYTFAGWTYAGQTTPVLSVTIPVGTTGDKTYTANWTADSFTLTFNADGGSVSPESKTVTYDASFTLPTPSKSGYTFAGWFNGTKQYTDGTWKETANVTLKAKWTANSYTVTYDDTTETRANVVVTFNYNYTGSTSTTTTLTNGQTLSRPTNPTRSGYVFTGWYTNSSCTTRYSFTGSITNDMTLYAGWISVSSYSSSAYSSSQLVASDYTSSYDYWSVSTSGTSSSSKIYRYFVAEETGTHYVYFKNSSSSYYYDYYLEIKNLTTGTTIRSNSTVGSTSYASKSFTCSAGDVIMISLYRYYTSYSSYYSTAYFYFSGFNSPATSTATASCSTFTGYEYSNGASSSTTVTFGSSHTLPTLERTGYTFDGWYNGTNKVESGAWNIASNVTLTPKWTANTYTVNFNANGGSVSPTSKTATYDSSFTLPTPTWAGHTFSGWYNGSTKITSGTWKYTTGMNLTARWDAVDYTISYTMNGGTNNGSNPSTYTVNDAVTLKDPTKTGYTFLGWTYSGQTTPTKTVNIAEGTMGNLSYTANWEKNTYTVTFDANGGSVSPTSKQVTYDESYTVPTPTRTGYTFAGWYSGGTKYTGGTWKTASNTTLTASWTAKGSIPYVVNHHKENVAGTGYDTPEVQNLTGTADATITPAVKSYTGFTSPSAKTVKIAPDGTLVVDYYYTRNSYSITFVTNGGDSITTINQKYQSSVTVPNATRTGYTFGGWYTNKTLTTKYTGTTISSSNITLYAYWAEENKPSDFTYSGTSAITISAYNGTSTTMWIPAYIGGVPVTTIPSSAFANKTALVKVVIPNTVTSIGSAAFKGCSALETLSIPFVGDKKHDANSEYKYTFGYIFGTSSYTGGVSTSQRYMTTSAGEGKFNTTSKAYYIPSSLKNIVITGTDYIQYGSFDNCTNIESVTLPQTISTIKQYAFYNCTSLKKLNSSIDGEFIIPSGVKSIGEAAFMYNKKLATLTIPTTVTSIGDNAFDECNALSKVNSTTEGTMNLPSGLKSIGTYAFRKNTSLTTIIVPNTVTKIGAGAFSGCGSLVEITLPFVGDSIKTSSDENRYSFGYIFGTSSYTGASAISQRYLGGDAGDGKFYIESPTYYIPSNLTKVTITGGYINYGAFYGCSMITTVNIPSNVTYIGKYAFYGCKNLSSLNSTTTGTFNIPDNVETIPIYAFYDCDGLTHLNLHDGIVRIDEHAFYACTNLEFVSACDNVNYIGYWAFYNCQKVSQFNSNNVGEMIIPSACTYIGANAFYGMAQITDLYVGSTVEEIGNGAFAGFATLENLTIPFVGDKNKTVADQYQYPLGYIFGTSSYTGGKGVTQYYVGENTNSYTSNTYYIPEKLKNVVVTDDTIISLGAFHNCSSVESITIPASVTYIGNYAFLECKALKTLNSDEVGEFNIPKAVTYIGRSTFNGCVNVSRVTIGNAIETIGYRAFYGCTALIQFNSDTPGEFIIPDTVTSIGEGAFYGSKMTSLTMPFVGASENCSTSLEMTLGHIFGYYDDTSNDYLTSASNEYTSQYSSSTSSNKYMFYIPDTLRTVTITKQTNIPYAAFMNCDLLTTITIPNNVESIGGYAFYNCKSLSKLNGTEIGTFNIPQSVTKIEKHAFQNCLEATNITLSNSVTAIDEYAFSGCAAIVQFNSNTLSELKVPTSCTLIGTNAFNGLAIIANVVVPDSVETIGSAAFRGCSSIKSMTLPFVGKSENCTSTGCMTFGYIFGYYDDTTYDNLTSTHSYTSQYTSETSSYKYLYYIPKTLETVVITKQTSIPYAAFMNCDLITSITLPDNTNFIGGYAFYNCKKLSSLNSSEVGEINIPSYVTTVEKYAFYNCIEISHVSLSDKVTAINDYAFYGCSAIVEFNSSTLGELIIPASCEKIGESAFYGLSSITSLKVSDMVSSIGAAAFGKMTTLQEMTVPFIGNKNKTSANTYQYPLGYFFGTSSYTGGTSTKQYYYGSSTTSTTYATYYIPTSLTKVIVTMGDLNYGAFYNCSKITSITVNENAVVNAEALHSCSATLSYASYTTPNYAWDGRTIATGYHSGSGTLNDPYIIANGDELAFFAQQVNAGVTYEGVYFKLSYDISLGNYEFGTIGTDSSYFKGVFDGNGHTISGLTINSNQQYVGLFSQTSGTIKNLGVYGTVTQTTETNLAAAGMLVGQLLNGGTISDCYTVGTLTSNSTYTIHCGGLVGYSKGTIANSYSSADVKATSSSLISYAGGLVGYLEGTVTNSAAYGDVYAKGSTDSYSRNGGFVGSSSESATITNCYRSNAQVLTKNGVANTAYNELGTAGTMSEILNFCKANWDNAKWNFVTVYPLFK